MQNGNDNPTTASVAEENKNQEKAKKTKKRKKPEKCENLRRCWGFCDFLKTSWKLFKEFSADTSIHGE